MAKHADYQKAVPAGPCPRQVSERVEGPDGRYYGTIIECKRRGGFYTQGACIGPLAERHDTVDAAARALIAFQQGAAA